MMKHEASCQIPYTAEAGWSIHPSTKFM